MPAQPTPSLSVAAAPLLATAILFLATARSWSARRTFVEAVALATLTLGAALVLAPLPAVVFNATLPLAAVVASWLAFTHAEWRFAPDFGQRGCGWAVHAAARSALPAAFGAAAALAPIAWLNRHATQPLASAALVIAAMLGLSALHRAMTRPTLRCPPPTPPDDDGGSSLRKPELILT